MTAANGPLTVGRVQELRNWTDPALRHERENGNHKQPLDSWATITALCDHYLSTHETSAVSGVLDDRALSEIGFLCEQAGYEHEPHSPARGLWFDRQRALLALNRTRQDER